MSVFYQVTKHFAGIMQVVCLSLHGKKVFLVALFFLCKRGKLRTKSASTHTIVHQI